MKLLFDADFTKDGKPDSSKWTYELGDHGWGNGELQNYTDNIENAYIKDGMLTIEAKKEQYGYSSAKLTTYGKFSFMYGSVRMVARLPKEVGSWPACWMLPNIFKEGVHWPKCGEIDVLEHVGTEYGRVHFSLHSLKNNFKKGTQKKLILENVDVSGDFHEYRVDWKKNSFVFYLDGNKVCEFDKEKDADIDTWPFDTEQYLIINLAIGGCWPGNPKDDFIKAKYEIKSLKVYEIEE